MSRMFALAVVAVVVCGCGGPVADPPETQDAGSQTSDAGVDAGAPLEPHPSRVRIGDPRDVALELAGAPCETETDSAGREVWRYRIDRCVVDGGSFDPAEPFEEWAFDLREGLVADICTGTRNFFAPSCATAFGP